MDLIIATFGSRIRRSHEQIVVQMPRQGETRKYPARRLNRILILGRSSISSDAVRLAIKHHIDVAYIGKFGKPEARIVPSAPTGSTKVRHAQLRAALMGDTLGYAKKFIIGKIINQSALAAAMHLTPDHKNIEKNKAMINAAATRAGRAKNTGSLMSAEGHAAERYFSGVWSHVFRFSGRNPDGKDIVNVALNYGYGILYNEVERAVLFAGLDPFIGILHSERYGKPSLVLDAVEEFRVPVIDAAILPMFANGLFERRDFIRKTTGYVIGASGRRKIINEVFSQLNTRITWKNRRRKLADIITYQSQELARSLTGRTVSYHAFVASNIFYEKSISPHRHLVERPKPKKKPYRKATR
jgi:CRISPR-associated protein Cas1